MDFFGILSMVGGLALFLYGMHLLGGDLDIRWDAETNHVFMKGPATTVFDGEIDTSHIDDEMHKCQEWHESIQ